MSTQPPTEADSWSPPPTIEASDIENHATDVIGQWMRYVEDSTGQSWRCIRQTDGTWLASASGAPSKRFLVRVSVTEEDL
jgi:hypothetical protein